MPSEILGPICMKLGRRVQDNTESVLTGLIFSKGKGQRSKWSNFYIFYIFGVLCPLWMRLGEYMREPITGMTRTNQCTRERSASMYSDSLTGIAPLMRYYGYGYHGYGLVK